MSGTPDRPIGRIAPLPVDELDARAVYGTVSGRLFGGADKGVRVGRYVIAEQIGSGGLGVVYRAYDPDLERNVALKLVRAQPDAGAVERERLLHEAHAMARLSHPNVVHVYDVGIHEGNVFITMELVRGQTLRQWMQPVRSWREVVPIFIQAGRGLAAAHDQEIVHRDFKPDNVMVGRDGRVRVLDFGLARPPAPDSEATPRTRDGLLRSDTPHSSQSGLVRGTPAYMAPEQYLQASVDPRADQFAFCVALFEAVHGRRPFAGRSVESLATAVTSGQFEAIPSTRSVPRWLRDALRRGMDPDPRRRWPSMPALLARLRRGLSGGTRRAVVLVGACVGLVGATWVVADSRDDATCSGAADRLGGVWDDDRRQRVRAAVLATDVPYAEGAWTEAAAALDDYSGRWVAMRTQACEATVVRGEQSPELLDRRIACLDDKWGEFAARVDVLTQADASAVQRMGEIVGRLPPIQDCEDFERLMDRLPLPTDATARTRAQELFAQLAAATAEELAGHFAQAHAIADQVVRAEVKLDHPPLRAEALGQRGASANNMGDHQAAYEDLLEAFFLARAIDHPIVVGATAQLLSRVTGINLARHDDGLMWARHAEAEAQRTGNTWVRWSTAMVRAGIYRELGRHADAERHARDALDLAEASDELGPRERGMSLKYLGNALGLQGRQHEALEVGQAALQQLRLAEPPEHPRIGAAHNDIAIVFDDLGQYERALEHYERATAILEPALGSDSVMIASIHSNIGLVLTNAGRPSQALDHLVRADEGLARHLGPDHPALATVKGNLGIAYRALDRDDDALDAQLASLAILRGTLGDEHRDVGRASLNVAIALHSLQRYEEAIDHFGRAFAVLQATLSPEHPWIGSGASAYGETLVAAGRVREGIGQLERGLAILDKAAGDPTHLANARFALAQTLWDETEDRVRALELAEQAEQAYAALGGTHQMLQDIRAWRREHAQ